MASNKTKTKNKKKGKNHEEAVVKAVAENNGEVSEQTKKKTKKYSRSVPVNIAAAVAQCLVYNARKFRGSYEGDTLYSIRVDKDDKQFLDEILDRLGPEK